MEIEIKYNQKNANLTLVLGLLFTALFIISLFYGSRPAYLILVLGAANIATYAIRRNCNYLTVQNGMLKKAFGPGIHLKDITDTRRFAGEYIFKSANKKIVIDKNKVDENSIVHVEGLIQHLREGNF